MAGVLELSDREFKTTMIDMVRALIDKVGNEKKIANPELCTLKLCFKNEEMGRFSDNN